MPAPTVAQILEKYLCVSSFFTILSRNTSRGCFCKDTRYFFMRIAVKKCYTTAFYRTAFYTTVLGIPLHIFTALSLSSKKAIEKSSDSSEFLRTSSFLRIT